MTNQITQSIIVKQELSDIYQLWSNFENFPKFMKHIKSVRKMDDQVSHWVLEGPFGFLISWEVETTAMEPKRIAWNSKDKLGDIKTSGQVTFNELSADETEVTVTLQYVPPAGVVGEMTADLLIRPEKRLREDLQNFKKYAENMEERLSV